MIARLRIDPCEEGYGVEQKIVLPDTLPGGGEEFGAKPSSIHLITDHYADGEERGRSMAFPFAHEEDEDDDEEDDPAEILF